MLAAISNYEGVSCFDETGWGTTFSSPVCPGKDSAIEFCKNVYSELIELFPYKYVLQSFPLLPAALQEEEKQLQVKQM